MKQCECGCGSVIKEDRRFVSGHNTRCELPEVREKRIKAIKNRYDNDPGYKERQKKSHSLNPAIWTEEKRKEISDRMKGKVFSEEHKKKLSRSLKKYFSNMEVRAKRAEDQKKMWVDEIYRKKQLRSIYIGQARKPTSPELLLLKLLNALYPNEWKYTGDFSFMINGKNPDFVNCNGQKKIIELFGDYWHKGEDINDRKKIFKPFGYETLVIWEHELKNKKELIGKIQHFCEQEQR